MLASDQDVARRRGRRRTRPRRPASTACHASSSAALIAVQRRAAARASRAGDRARRTGSGKARRGGVAAATAAERRAPGSRSPRSTIQECARRGAANRPGTGLRAPATTTSIAQAPRAVPDQRRHRLPRSRSPAAANSSASAAPAIRRARAEPRPMTMAPKRAATITPSAAASVSSTSCRRGLDALARSRGKACGQAPSAKDDARHQQTRRALQAAHEQRERQAKSARCAGIVNGLSKPSTNACSRPLMTRRSGTATPASAIAAARRAHADTSGGPARQQAERDAGEMQAGRSPPQSRPNRPPRRRRAAVRRRGRGHGRSRTRPRAARRRQSGGRAASATIMPSTMADIAMPISTPAAARRESPITPPSAITSGNTIGSSQIAGAPRNAPHKPDRHHRHHVVEPEQRMREAAEKAAAVLPLARVWATAARSKPYEQHGTVNGASACATDSIGLRRDQRRASIGRAGTRRQRRIPRMTDGHADQTTGGSLRPGSLHLALALGQWLRVAGYVAAGAARRQNQHMDTHPSPELRPRRQHAVRPPAIKIKSGKILWLAGTTALPVYHDHPHKRDQIQQYMAERPRSADALRDGRHQADARRGRRVVQGRGALFRLPCTPAHRRHRQGECGDQLAISRRTTTSRPRPTSAVLELGEPEQLIEIQMFAVVD